MRYYTKASHVFIIIQCEKLNWALKKMTQTTSSLWEALVKIIMIVPFNWNPRDDNQRIVLEYFWNHLECPSWFKHILLYMIQMVRTQVLTTYKVFTTKQTICTKTYNYWLIIITIVIWKDTRLNGIVIIVTFLLFESREI
mgnify:CR=1 FL=1